MSINSYAAGNRNYPTVPLLSLAASATLSINGGVLPYVWRRWGAVATWEKAMSGTAQNREWRGRLSAIRATLYVLSYQQLLKILTLARRLNY
jgi:hypothetical protein